MGPDHVDLALLLATLPSLETWLQHAIRKKKCDSYAMSLGLTGAPAAPDHESDR